MKGTLQPKHSLGIPLHAAILAKNEVEALAIINRLKTKTSTKPNHNVKTNGRPFYGNPASTCVCITPAKNTGMQVVYKNPYRPQQQTLEQLAYAPDPHLFEVNSELQNALQLAADNGLEQTVQRLLELGIEPNYCDGFGRTALHYAAAKGHLNIIRLLIAHGADTSLCDAGSCFPLFIYLRECKGIPNRQIMGLLQIDLLAVYRDADGKMKSESMSGTDHIRQLFTEQICRLKMRAELIETEFVPERNAAKMERRELNQAQELAYTRELLSVMVEILSIICSLPDDLILEKLQNKELLNALQFFGMQISCLAKEVKSPYQDRIPWNNLEFLAYLFRVPLKPDFQIAFKELITQTFPVVERDLRRVIGEFDQWIDKNNAVVQHRPFRHADLTALYNFTDYFHDRVSLLEIDNLLNIAESTNVKLEYSSRALLQIVKTIADLTKYQHHGRNLTRTIKEKIPAFPWNALGELRDKLAKISLLHGNVTYIEDLIKNNPQFFIDLQQELISLRRLILPVMQKLNSLHNSQLNEYYRTEPLSEETAREEMNLNIAIAESSVAKFVGKVNEIKDLKLKQLLVCCQQLEQQISGMSSNTKMPEEKKQALLAGLQKKLYDSHANMEAISLPYNRIIEHCTGNGQISLSEQRFLFDEYSKGKPELKGIIANNNPWKRILELENRLIFKKDEKFSKLPTDAQHAIRQRLDNYLRLLSDLIHPGSNILSRIDANIFTPGHDEFSRELYSGLERIAADSVKRYAAYYLCVEIQQSLRFALIGGNTELRIHLDHDNRAFQAVMPDRLREEMNGMLHNLVEYRPAHPAQPEPTGFFRTPRTPPASAAINYQDSYKKATALFRSGNFREALNELNLAKRAIENANSSQSIPIGDQVRVFYSIGFCHKNLGELQEAAEAFNHALDLDPVKMAEQIQKQLDVVNKVLHSQQDLPPSGDLSHASLAGRRGLYRETPQNKAKEKRAVAAVSSDPNQIHPGLHHQIIIGDGDCLYSAVTYYLSHGEDVAFLRRIVAANFECDLERYAGFAALGDNQTVQEYIADIRDTPAWANNLEINILMRLLNRPIVIIDPEGTVRNIEEIRQYQSDPIFVYYNDLDHYDVFVLNDGFNSRNILGEILQRSIPQSEDIQAEVADDALKAGPPV